MISKNYLRGLALATALICSNALAVNDDITALASIQDAEGVTQSDFNLDMLRAFENHTVATMKEKMSSNLRDKGFPNAKVDIVPSSVYFDVSGKRLAVVRLKHPPYALNQVFVFGVVGKELRRVVCTRQAAEQIPLSYGSCSKKIEEVYGIKLLKN